MKNNLEKGVSGMMWMSIMTAGNFGVQLVITFFLARLLTPSDYGEVAALTVLTGFADIFWMMGVGPGIVQKDKVTDDDISTGQNLNILFGLIVFAVINIFAHFFVNIFGISDINMLRVFSTVFVINSLYSVPQSLIQRACDFKVLALTKIISVIVYGVVSISLSLVGGGAWSLVMGTIFQNMANLVIFTIKTKMILKVSINSTSAKQLLYFGAGFTIARIFSYIANNGDKYIVNRTLGKVLLGNYTKAYQLLMYPVTMLGDTLDQVLFPVLAREQKNVEQLKKAFIYGTCVIALVSVPTCIVAYWIAEDLVLFFLGEQWGKVVIPFQIMIVGLFFRIGYKLSDSLIRAIGKVYKRAYIQAIYATLVVLGAYVGHFEGLSGVAIGVTAAFTINYFMMTFLSVKSINLSVYKLMKNVIPILLGGVICFGMIYIIIDIWGKSSNYFLNCVIVTLITFSIYFGIYIILLRKMVDWEFNNFIKTILRTIKRKFIK